MHTLPLPRPSSSLPGMTNGSRHLFARHDGTYTPSEMAEMLVDSYEGTPRCTSCPCPCPLRLPIDVPNPPSNAAPLPPSPDAKAAVGFICGVITIAGAFNALALFLRKTRCVQADQRL